MLLCEIIKHPITGQEADAKLTQKDFSIGCKTIKMDSINKEEADAFAAIGIDPRTLKNIPIAYGYELPFGGGKQATTPEMDALKMRKGWNRENAEADIMSGMTFFARRLYGDTEPTSSGTRKRQQSIKNDLKAVQRILRSPILKTIVVVPSSSELPMMLATALESVLKENGEKCTILDPSTLTKVHPKISQHRIDTIGLNRDKIIDYAGNEDKLNSLQTRMDKLSPSSLEYAHVKKQIDELIKKIEKHGKFQIKNHMGAGAGVSDHGKVYYGWIKAHEHDISTSVIIIDDNVVSGRTVGEAAKELVRLHRKPLNICGIALHHFTSPKTTSARSVEYDHYGDRVQVTPANPGRNSTLKSVKLAISAGVLNKNEVDAVEARETAGTDAVKSSMQSKNGQLNDEEKAIVARASAFRRNYNSMTPREFASFYKLPTYEPLNSRTKRG